MTVVNLDVARVSLASEVPSATSLSSFKNKPVREWLGAAHPSSGGQVLKADGRPLKKLRDARKSFSDDDLVSLIAATGPNHCLDGWSFLARAAAALVARDSHAARHFAYYAQLRGALSILACSGIGVFNGLNIFANINGNISKLENSNEASGGTGTHGIVWPALDAWARDDRNAEKFLSALTVHGAPILGCIRSIWPSRQASSIVAPIINHWALDLPLGTAHHLQRNISSYNPHELNPVGGRFIPEMEFLAQTWALMRPSAPLGFDQLDVHFLRQTLQSLHDEDSSHLPVAERVTFAESPIATRYDELEHTVKQSVPLGFLTADRATSEPALFAHAREDGTAATSMISRAILLLRAATGFSTNAFNMAGMSVDGADLRPWLDPVLEARGFAEAGEPPVSMADLWDEVSYAVDDFETAISLGTASPNSLLSSPENGLPVVTQFERAGIWSLCP